MIFVLRGMQGSGKSRLASMAAPRHCVLSTDEYRERYYGTAQIPPQVGGFWKRFHEDLEYRAKYRMFTIVDATHSSIRGLRKTVARINKWGCPYVILNVETPFEDCWGTIEARKRNAVSGVVLEYDRFLEAWGTFNHHTLEIEDKYRDHFISGSMTDCYNTLLYLKNRMNTVHCGEGPVYVIGDIHGMIDHLRMLLDKIPENALIVTVGDIIDRGPDSFGCLDMLFKDERVVRSVMGNHEFSFLCEHIHGYEAYSKARKKTHEIFSRFDKDSRRFYLKLMKNLATHLVLTRDDSDEKVLVTHAGMDESDYHLTNLHHTTTNLMNDPDIDKKLPEGIRQVHGHKGWEYTGDFTKDIINVDSHCYKSGILTAFDPFTNDVIYVSKPV